MTSKTDDTGFQEAHRLLQDTLNSPKLMESYSQAGLDAIQSGNNAPITAWFTANGYNTDATMAFQAFENMGENNLATWAGIYGTTYLTDSNKKVTAGPPLVVFSNATAAINSLPIANFTFANSKLSWTQTDNPTAGAISFYQQDPNQAAQGNDPNGPKLNFYGTLVLTTGGPTLTYSGTIGPVTAFPLEYWSGHYSQTYLKPDGGNATAGPILIIQDATTVTLAGAAIAGFTYNDIGNQLSWGFSGGNTTAGSINFTKITTPSGGSTYVGPFFFGTLQQSQGGPSLQFSGRLGTPTQLSDWVGVYGVTILTTGSTPATGPTLTVQGNGVLLDTAIIAGYAFDQDTSTLSWPLTGNATAAQVKFSRLTTPCRPAMSATSSTAGCSRAPASRRPRGLARSETTLPTAVRSPAAPPARPCRLLAISPWASACWWGSSKGPYGSRMA